LIVISTQSINMRIAPVMWKSLEGQSLMHKSSCNSVCHEGRRYTCTKGTECPEFNGQTENTHACMSRQWCTDCQKHKSDIPVVVYCYQHQKIMVPACVSLLLCDYYMGTVYNYFWSLAILFTLCLLLEGKVANFKV